MSSASEARSVLEAVRRWAEEEVPRQPPLLRLGLFGSYARGDAGVGSDIDLVAIVSESAERFERRALRWRTETLPLPAELLVYTETEWAALLRDGSRLAHTIERDAAWLFERSK